MNSRLLTALSIVVLAAAATPGQTPLGTAFTYQGQLKSGGSPANGSFNMDFKLYPVPAGGTLLASQTLPGVSVTDGLFTVQVDFGAGVFDGNQRWLDVTVNGSPLVPRQELTAAPHALFALNASTATTATNATQLNGQPAAFYQNASNLNAGTLPSARLSGTYGSALTLNNAANAFTGSGAGLTLLNATNLASGTVADTLLSSNVALLNNTQTFSAAKTFSSAPSFTAAGAPISVTSTTLVTNLNADLLDGMNSTAFLQTIPVPLTLSGTSASHIIRGENTSTTSGAGIYGWASGVTTAPTYGVYGQSDSLFGSGVYGLALGTAATGVIGSGYDGVKGIANGTFGSGVLGLTTSTSGIGVQGSASATSGITYGVVGESTSSGTNATGVFGWAGAQSGTTYGVWGTSLSAAGYGVYGSVSGGTQNAGVYGNSSAFNGNGIIGEAFSGASAFGVWAKAPQGTGVYCQGALTVTGSKSFRIDHPFDPENKYLIHYCSEGPEPLNVYRGNVVTDASGYAVIALPSYFEEINRDVSYQLTVIDNSDDFVLAKVLEGVKDNSFTVRTSKPNVHVSWEVKGVRNDLYIRNYGAPVEVDKTDKDRGTYQHPELYGQPKERMFGYVPEGRPPRRPKQ